MSAWTWTHIKVTAIDRERGLKYCELAEKDVNSLWYYEDYLKLPEEKAFHKYLNFFKKWKDDLNIPKHILNSPKKFEAWVKERYYENIEQCTNLLKWIEKYRNEECTFEELVNNSSIGDRLHCRISIFRICLHQRSPYSPYSRLPYNPRRLSGLSDRDFSRIHR